MKHLDKEQIQYIALVSLSGAGIALGVITMPDFGLCLSNPIDLSLIPAMGASVMGYIAYQVVSTDPNK